jgi:hypothetical protein
MTSEEKDQMDWSESVADLIVYVLVDSEIVKKEDYEDAVKVVAEELFVRLLCRDYPPPFDIKLLTENSPM